MSSSILLSDNGVTSGSAGIKSTGGNDGVLLLQTTTSGGAATTAVTVDNAQNVGVGVTPSASSVKTFEIGAVGLGLTNRAAGKIALLQNAYYNASFKYAVTGQTTAMYEVDNGVHYWYNAAAGTAGNAISFTQAMTLDASGNLALGQTSASGRMDIASTGAQLYLRYTGNTGFNSITSDVSNNLIFTQFAGERMRLDSSGNLLVGTTDSGTTTGVGIKNNVSATAPQLAIVGSSTSDGNDAIRVYSTGAAAYRFEVTYAGKIYATTTTITGISDQRLKENIRDLDDGLSTVMALQPRKFDWKKGKGADVKNARGFIAQEFEQVFPDLIEEWRDPAPEGEESYKAVRADLIPVLVKAIQEQQALIQSLTDRLTALEGAAK